MIRLESTRLIEQGMRPIRNEYVETLKSGEEKCAIARDRLNKHCDPFLRRDDPTNLNSYHIDSFVAKARGMIEMLHTVEGRIGGRMAVHLRQRIAEVVEDICFRIEKLSQGKGPCRRLANSVKGILDMGHDDLDDAQTDIHRAVRDSGGDITAQVEQVLAVTISSRFGPLLKGAIAVGKRASAAASAAVAAVGATFIQEQQAQGKSVEEIAEAIEEQPAYQSSIDEKFCPDLMEFIDVQLDRLSGGPADVCDDSVIPNIIDQALQMFDCAGLGSKVTELEQAWNDRCKAEGRNVPA